MMRGGARVLKPGDRVALADFIFTDERVKDLAPVSPTAVRNGFPSFWIARF